METLGQCEERVLQLQERIAKLERDNTTLWAELSNCQQAEASFGCSLAQLQALFEQSPLSSKHLLITFVMAVATLLLTWLTDKTQETKL